VTISAFVTGLRALGLFGFSSQFDSEFVISVFLAVHSLDSGIGIITVGKNLA
jgi:hypothetical protein